MTPIDWQSFCKHDHKQICGFFGDYRWCSNYHIATVHFEGVDYKSTEHAYHAAKCVDPEQKVEFRNYNMTCGQSKAFGRIVKLRPDWEQVKFDVMLQLTVDKYTRHPRLRELLLATGNRYIEETNNWGDLTWGVDARTGKGENRLGEILMRVRALLQPPSNPTTPMLFRGLVATTNFGEF